MISLPGLNLSSQPAETQNGPTSTATRTQELAANTEYRFEVSFSRTLTVKLQSGTAEFFGTELAPSTTYTFQGTKGAIFTWHGCKLDIGGEVESDYIAEETPMMSCANLHFALENLRDRSIASGSVEMGPRVLVVGPENSGKTSLVKTLTSYAVKTSRQPMVINLDPRQGMLSVPGSFSAAVYSSIVDIEEGWGSSPISGPSPIPVKMPLVYHYGLKDPEEGKVFKPLVTRMALAVTSRLEEDKLSKQAGFIIDSSGAISQGRNGVYDNIEHIVSEFSINVLITLGSERLYSDLSRKFSARTGSDPSETVFVIRLDKSGGCVDRSEEYMEALRHAQIKEYFFGKGDETLAPSSQMADAADLNIFRVIEGDVNGGVDEYGMTVERQIFEKVTPSEAMQNQLLAITTASPNDPQAVIRDSSIRGYIYVADVDEAKKKVKLLSPLPGATPGNAMILGKWPETVEGLVN
ncbi:mRNA cleavage and polyadenylation factor IA/II complex [Alternaria alternata]|uniref:Polynucleotide 5'-hydroxyl-kinase GRC3 n=3 Tax=Alternaria sect. Alternaria TaxID=2499237 RepID=A0A177DLW6_ALTAL|nr:mRNA cleavage and polyadenylation factor IA/II complex [Alternaria alternata]XP_028505667.1 mRNA cleavage and polyadenylation factor [Alternaria arborescens]XP_051591677.1 Cleavage polyadenylation factor subunit clp1 [Alternaria postmessia]RII16914.1 mRNA cleavage and polyadenylation factor IA/II complex [Alternaria sp. MG1]RYN28291.1 mRNA cleavage and polyadenylation factor [Alternaria tenuissima]KAH6862045.1 mRNA cleavage and polyadenylation factor IA/II complex [Alternaria alternata]KAI